MHDDNNSIVRMQTIRAFFATALAMTFLPWTAGAQTPAPAKPSEPWATVQQMAKALGHIRPVMRSDQGVAAISFTANGSMFGPGREKSAPWREYKVSKLVGETSYFLRDSPTSAAKSPGARWDIHRTGPNGEAERVIRVVAGQFSWNETQPGVGFMPAMEELADRQRMLWVTPHGLALAAMRSDGKPGAAPGVKVRRSGGNAVLTIPVNVTPMAVTLDANMRPIRVEARIAHPIRGQSTLKILYSDYRDFEKAYYVYFPTRIEQQLDGKTMLDLAVTEFHTNPYVVFPVPAEARAQS
jgi:hypothetical protein